MNSLNLKSFITTIFIDIFNKYNIKLIEKSGISHLNNDGNYILLSNFDKIGELTLYDIYTKKGEDFGVAFNIEMEINKFTIKHHFSYHPTENGKTLQSFFKTLEEDIAFLRTQI